MKISVITPSYNQGRFIGNCLASVQSQTGDFRVEHIILDNCSTDASADALKHYQASHGSVDLQLFIEADQGQSSAINKGFCLATGDIVCWLNTDETFKDDVLCQVAEYFTTHPEVDVVFGDCDFVDADGRLLKQKREFFFSKSMLLFYGCYIPSCATFVRRNVVDAGLLLNPGFKVVMDFDWYVRIARAGYRFAHLPATLATFTWHEANISSNLVARRKSERLLVQDQNIGIPGPGWLRAPIYFLMLRLWQSVRVTRRFIELVKQRRALPRTQIEG